MLLPYVKARETKTKTRNNDNSLVLKNHIFTLRNKYYKWKRSENGLVKWRTVCKPGPVIIDK
jgi:hypothetical protein